MANHFTKNNIMQKITPFLWFDNQAEEAANFYVSIFKDATLGKITRYGANMPAPEGSVMTVSFQLFGQEFTALNAGPVFKFNEAISFVVNCGSQEEVDYYWEKLTADGGEESACGWLKDKFGLSWQIVPDVLPSLMANPDPAKAQKAASALMQMRKIDIEKLKQAALADTAQVIMVEAQVAAPLETAWNAYTAPEDIVLWNNASDDWHTPRAENDLREGGRFNYRMEARDGSFGFDFEGVYDRIDDKKRIEYTMGDGRKVQVNFSPVENGTHVGVTFEAENTHSLEMQQGGWQAILNNFKKFAESKS
jgi:predicted 3-demethylubiquinone-9 3-methyltransferase (glyoxalase superfamily)/uncharacterized protein YndB with AHSA1/START domain